MAAWFSFEQHAVQEQLREQDIWRIELWRLDLTPLLKYLDVDQDREHLKIINVLLFIIIIGKSCTLIGENKKKLFFV